MTKRVPTEAIKNNSIEDSVFLSSIEVVEGVGLVASGFKRLQFPSIFNSMLIKDGTDSGIFLGIVFGLTQRSTQRRTSIHTHRIHIGTVSD